MKKLLLDIASIIIAVLVWNFTAVGTVITWIVTYVVTINNNFFPHLPAWLDWGFASLSFILILGIANRL